MGDLVFDKFIRTPFQVKAVRITNENMDQVAELCGEVKTRKGERYIALDPHIIPNVKTAYRGWYITMLGDGLRCYAPKVFRDQFTKLPDGRSITVTFPEDADEGPEVSTEVDDLVELPQPAQAPLETPQQHVGTLVPNDEAIVSINADDMTDAERATQTFLKTD